MDSSATERRPMWSEAGGGLRWRGRRIQSSPSATNTPKIHLHVEKFWLKINLKLAEGLLNNQG